MAFNSKNRVLAFAITGIATIICVYQFRKDASETAKIKSDLRHAVAEVVETKVNPKSKHISVGYAFSVGNSTYFGKNDYKPLNGKSDSLMHHFFPIVYFNDDPGINQLLITEADFKKYELTQPDSLKLHNALLE